MTYTVGSLFAGIGGFDLGFERAGFDVAWQVELDPYCRRVLRKHWPDARRWDDVRTFPPDPLEDWRVDVLVGGFPCTDISYAGNRAGLAGAHSGLWREMVRTFRLVRPKFWCVENVAALLTLGMGTVLGDMAESGCDAEWDCVPASAFGAHHQRDRVFITAHSTDADCLRSQGEWSPPQGTWSREQFEGLVQAILRTALPAGTSGGVSDGAPSRLHRLRALGNAVVPQVAEFVARRVKATLEATT